MKANKEECQNFKWAAKQGYIRYSEIERNWYIQAVGYDDATDLLLAVYHCPYCGKSLEKYRPKSAK